jgi:predicted transcriptional regulator YdeE
MKDATIAKIEEIKVIGLQLRTKYCDMSAATQIGALWQKFFQEKCLEHIPHQTQPQRIVALYTDYDRDGNCTLILGAQVVKYEFMDMPKGMVFRKVPAGYYQLFAAEGPKDQIVGQTWKKIWENKELQRTFESDFELYDVSNLGCPDINVEIYIGIRYK